MKFYKRAMWSVEVTTWVDDREGIKTHVMRFGVERYATDYAQRMSKAPCVVQARLIYGGEVETSF